jgi:hypothetical protein
VDDDLRPGSLEGPDIAAVILVMVGDEHIPHGCLRYGPDLFQQRLVVVLTEVLGIDDDQPLVGGADRGVTTETGDHVKARLDFLDGWWGSLPASPALATRTAAAPPFALRCSRRRCRGLLCRRADDRRHDRRGDDRSENSSAHWAS